MPTYMLGLDLLRLWLGRRDHPFFWSKSIQCRTDLDVDGLRRGNGCLRLGIQKPKRAPDDGEDDAGDD